MDLFPVVGASGSTYEVWNQEEADWFDRNLSNYLDQYKFENVADLQDLDRMISLELQSYRYARWLIAGVDYDNKTFDEKWVRDHKTVVDRELRLVKKSMGLDRKGRTESESENMADYLKNLLQRAEEFGMHRDNQIAKAIDLFNDLKSLIGQYDRMDEEERREMKMDVDDIMRWIRETAIPEYDKIDDAFRANQKYWIGEV